MRKYPDSNFNYCEDFDVFYSSVEVDPIIASSFIDNLPRFITDSDREEILQKICQSQKISWNLIDFIFRRRFHKQGTFWVFGKTKNNVANARTK